MNRAREGRRTRRITLHSRRRKYAGGRGKSTWPAGSGVYYYTYTAWDVLRPRETPPGYAYFKHLHDFFEATGYWRMTPTEGITADGYCLAEAGREYVVFLNSAKPFTMKLEGLAAPLEAEWYHPFTGERKGAGTAGSGTARFTPPATWHDDPVVLHVGKAR